MHIRTVTVLIAPYIRHKAARMYICTYLKEYEMLVEIGPAEHHYGC
jgi:hypothetical protein